MKDKEDYQQVTGSVYRHIKEASDEELLSDEVRDKIPADLSFFEEYKKEKYSEIRLLEMMRRLKDSIEKLNKTTSCYSKILIFLTILIAILTLIMILNNQKLC